MSNKKILKAVVGYEADKDKIAKIKLSGNGDLFLNDKGEYISVDGAINIDNLLIPTLSSGLREYYYEGLEEQTEFVLPASLGETDSVLVFINGLKKRINRDFTINGSTVVLTSALTEASDVDVVILYTEYSTDLFYATDSNGDKLTTSTDDFIVFNS